MMTGTEDNQRSSCDRHEDRPAISLCADCGVLMCAGCMRRRPDGLAHCQDCAAVDTAAPRPSAIFERRTEALHSTVVESNDHQQESEPRPSATIIPWENPETKGDISAFFRTLAFAFTHPVLFMGFVPWTSPKIGSPLTYAVLVGVLGQLAQMARLLINPQLLLDAMPKMPALAHISPSSLILATLPFIPMVVVMTIFMQSFLAHGILKLIGAAPLPFGATFRVFAYAESAAILLWLPGIGPYAYKFWAVFMALQGLRVAQKAGFSASLLALLPMFLLTSMAN